MKPQKPSKLLQQQSFERASEKPRYQSDNKVEQAIVNFTRIPEVLIENALSIMVEGTVAQPKNHTDLNDPEVRKQMEAGMDSQDNKQASIAAIKRQLNNLRNEEAQARNYFAQQDQEKQQAEQQEAQQKAQREKQAREQQTIQPTTKQKPGMLGQKRKKTAETSAAFGKQ